MEFEFTQGSLEAAGLVEGDEVECTYSESEWFLVGKVYRIYDNKVCGSLRVVVTGGPPFRYCDHRLVKFKPLKDEQPSIDPDVAIQRLESVMEYVNKKLDFLNSNGVQSFQLNEVKRLMNGE